MSGWIDYKEGDVIPEFGTEIDVKYRDGTVLYAQFVGKQEEWINSTPYGTTSAFWQNDDRGNDIIAYQLSNTMFETPGMAEELAECERYYRVVPGTNDVELVSDKAATQDTNPKQALGMSKLPMHLASPLPMAYMALGLANGALKYGKANYKATPVLASIYIDGFLRHVEAWLEGEEFDPDDGAPHLGAALANIAIIIEARAAGTLVDDRPIGEGYLKEREALTAIWRGIQEKHKDKNPKHYTRGSV